MSRMTAVLAAVFFVTSLTLSYLATNRPKASGSVIDAVKTTPADPASVPASVPAPTDLRCRNSSTLNAATLAHQSRLFAGSVRTTPTSSIHQESVLKKVKPLWVVPELLDFDCLLR